MAGTVPHPDDSSAHTPDNTISAMAVNTRLGSSTANGSRSRETSYVVVVDGTSQAATEGIK
jgi:hypothetical protein